VDLIPGKDIITEVNYQAPSVKKCGDVDFPPIVCCECGKDINSKFWKPYKELYVFYAIAVTSMIVVYSFITYFLKIKIF